MRNNNLKNIIKVINTALLVSTLTLSLTACGRTDGKSDNSNNEADTAVVAVNNSDTDSMQNVNADDLSVNSDENQNTSEADNTSAVTDNENNADIEDENKPKKMPQIVIIVDELADLIIRIMIRIIIQKMVTM